MEKQGCIKQKRGAKANILYDKICGAHDHGGKKSTSSSSPLLFHVKTQTTTTSSFKKFENSNRHQISQTNIPFCLNFRADHETMLRFHRGGLCREKSKQRLRIEKNENTKNNELSKIK